MPELTRRELTAALFARQLLLERPRIGAAEAVRRLTPLQGQHPPAPYLGLAARVEGFTRAALQAAIDAGEVVKSTLHRTTLHLAAADDYPAYAQVVRQARMRSWRKAYAHLDEERLVAELTQWLAEPRTNVEIRERIGAYDGVDTSLWGSVLLARTLLPLVQLPPAGHWDDQRRSRFVVYPRPLPEPADASVLVLTRYLEAFGPASKRDAASWAGVAQRDFAWDRLELVRYGDLLDLPGRPLPPADTKLPVRLLGHWDQALLAYADRERIMPPELHDLQLTLSGSPTVLVDGRVAASWNFTPEGLFTVTPHTDLSRAARAGIRAEVKRIAALAGMRRHEVRGL